MAVLTKQAILEADDLPRELVRIPEWDGEVYVRVLTAAELRDVTTNQNGDDPMAVTGRIFVRAVVDERGAPLFEAADLPALEAKSHIVWTRLIQRVMAINKLGDDDVEELEKNFGATRAK